MTIIHKILFKQFIFTRTVGDACPYYDVLSKN